jgi:hypothetical protein
LSDALRNVLGIVVKSLAIVGAMFGVKELVVVSDELIEFVAIVLVDFCFARNL